MSHSPFRIALASGLMLAAVTRADPPATTPDPFEGTWRGTVTAPNTQTDLGFTFFRGTKGLGAQFSMPAMFVQDMNLGPAQIKDGTYSMPFLGIRLTLANGALTGTFANPLLRVELHRGVPLSPAAVMPNGPPGPAPAWTRTLAAETWATPVVRDGVIYLGCADGKFHAIRANDGAESWTWAGPHPLYGEALVTDDSVYFVDEHTDLTCLARASGKLRWQRALHDESIAGGPAAKNPTFNRRVPVPVIADGVLYLGSTDHGLYALDAATGDLRWRHDAGAAIFGSVALASGRLVAGCFDGSVIVVDRATGQEIARAKLGGPIASAPVVAGDLLLVGCRDYLLYGLKLADLTTVWRNSYWFSWVESVPRIVDGRAYIGGSDYRRISDLDPATGRARWVTDVGGLTWGTPVVTADVVYAGTSAQNPAAIRHEGGITALDRRTGAVKWRIVVPLPEKAERAGYVGSLAFADGRLIGVTFDGTLTAYPLN